MMVEYKVMNNVINVNMDFIYNYIHWVSYCSLYFPLVLWLEVARKKVKVPRGKFDDQISSEKNDYLICD